jgi:hypothetical protein
VIFIGCLCYSGNEIGKFQWVELLARTEETTAYGILVKKPLENVLLGTHNSRRG